MVRELKWREKQKVVVLKKGSKLIIEDWVPVRRSLMSKGGNLKNTRRRNHDKSVS